MENCLDCGLKLTGRVDKKFCDDHCRSNYNNILNKDRHSIFKTINRILKNNATVLGRFNKHGLNELHRSILIAAGFNFTYFTHQLSGPGGKLYTCCYNYGYELMDGEILQIKEVGIQER